jgi:hypothetical protein
MDDQARLDELLAVAEELGIEIRRVSLGGEGGGLCSLRGKRVLFLDLSADAATRYDRTVEAMARLPEMQDRYLSPQLREDLDRAAREP